MEDSRRARLLRLQRMEATEAEVYRRLAKMQKDPVNRSILEGISLEEERHEAVIEGMTGEKVHADMRKVRRQIMLARLFGFTFSVKMMEATEQDAAAEYRELGLDDIAEEEDHRGERTKAFLIILDDVHNLGTEGNHLLGALLQIAETTSMRLLLISRTSMTFYDRRDVHMRGRVQELALSGLTIEEISQWLETLDLPSKAPAEEIHRATGGHPLAVELLEMYGQTLHDDWLRFLDEEILDVLPSDHREILALLAVADKPVPWTLLASAASFDGLPPSDLIERGLMLELSDGMWLHEALRARLLREVGAPLEERARKIREATD